MEKTGKEVASPSNGKAKTGRMTGAHQRGKARAARRAAAKVANTALTRLVTSIGGLNQTGHSTAHNQKKKSTSACPARAKCRINDMRYIRKKMQREDGH